MASRRQRRGGVRRAQPAAPAASATDDPPRLSLSRAEAAQALGVSLRTLDRQVVPRIQTALLEDGTRLIPLAELERCLVERTTPARTPMASSSRRAIPEAIRERIRSERQAGLSYRQIADRLQAEGVPTAQSGTRWWASTVRGALINGSD
ncbi:MAG: hypothetical protein QOK40_2225 [Miltoncostaeaceae bacterium]|nr:hypothetical protein [Miltoncostaeaceae bacterium]